MKSKTDPSGRLGVSNEVRDQILSDPDAILEDPELMRALIGANDLRIGDNVVDLRGAAIQRLEGKLDRLEDTHRGIIAAAYENVAGTNLIHRAILQMLEAPSFEVFLQSLSGRIAETLRVDSIRLVLESLQAGSEAQLPHLGSALYVAQPGFVDGYLTADRNFPLRQVVLRRTLPESAAVHGGLADRIGSEAAMRLDFGPGRLPGMLVFGSTNPQHFKPTHGTDLLAFLAAVFERNMRRWLQ